MQSLGQTSKYLYTYILHKQILYLSEGLEFHLRYLVISLMRVKSGLNNAGKCYLYVCPDLH
jgi:hypothetical protein